MDLWFARFGTCFGCLGFDVGGLGFIIVFLRF